MKILDLTKSPPGFPSCKACIYSAEDGLVCRRQSPTHVALMPEDEAFARVQGHYYTHEVDAFPHVASETGWCGDGMFLCRSPEQTPNSLALWTLSGIWGFYTRFIRDGADLSLILGPMEVE